MSQDVAIGYLNLNANKILRLAAQFWFSMTVVGQWFFVIYIVVFYGDAAVHGNFVAWNKVLTYGYVAGDAPGNLALTIHLFLAVIITVGGPIQLIPQIRSYAPSFHRWNGRLYLLTAVVMSITGLYRGFARGSIGGVVQHLGIGINAVLIIICAFFALRYALVHKFTIHRRWALRLFLVVSGVWFFRVGLMFWIVINQGPVGFDPVTFTGPFLDFLSFAQYLVPLAVLEIYLCTIDSPVAGRKVTMAAGLFVLTLAMSVGVFGATMFMWLPRI